MPEPCVKSSKKERAQNALPAKSVYQPLIITVQIKTAIVKKEEEAEEANRQYCALIAIYASPELRRNLALQGALFKHLLTHA